MKKPAEHADHADGIGGNHDWARAGSVTVQRPNLRALFVYQPIGFVLRSLRGLRAKVGAVNFTAA